MYEQFYGFSGQPFELAPDPAFYFESITHKKALSYLGYGLNQGEGFVVITGESGVGKSILVAHLKQQLDEGRMTVGEVVTSTPDDAEMVYVVARGFGLNVEGSDKPAAFAAIEAFLHEEVRSGRRCLLIVDDAQGLSIGDLEDLRMLSTFQLGSHPLLQTLFLGQPEFKHVLAQSDDLEQMRQRIIAAHQLEPMQPGEIEPYVQHRLRRVGWAGNPVLESTIWTRLHRATGGIPRKVNQAMTGLLEAAAVERCSTIDVELLDAVLGDLAASATPEETTDPRPDRDDPQAPTRSEDRGLTQNQIRAIEQAFAERDRHLSALRRDVRALEGGAKGQSGAALTDLDARLSRIEARLGEQEESLRHALAMMIAYFEARDPGSGA